MRGAPTHSTRESLLINTTAPDRRHGVPRPFPLPQLVSQPASPWSCLPVVLSFCVVTRSLGGSLLNSTLDDEYTESQSRDCTCTAAADDYLGDGQSDQVKAAAEEEVEAVSCGVDPSGDRIDPVDPIIVI